MTEMIVALIAYGNDIYMLIGKKRIIISKRERHKFDECYNIDYIKENNDTFSEDLIEEKNKLI